MESITMRWPEPGRNGEFDILKARQSGSTQVQPITAGRSIEQRADLIVIQTVQFTHGADKRLPEVGQDVSAGLEISADLGIEIGVCRQVEGYIPNAVPVDAVLADADKRLGIGEK